MYVTSLRGEDANWRSIHDRTGGPRNRRRGATTSTVCRKSPMTQPLQILWPVRKSRPSALFQMTTASDEVMGAITATARRRRRSRPRRRSGAMFSVTIDPQKMKVSMAPASAKSMLVGHAMPLQSALASLPR